MPTQISNSPFSKRVKSQPNLLLNSSFSTNTDLNIRKNELFSPTCATSTLNRGANVSKTNPKTDFFSATNMSRLKTTHKNEYIDFHDNRAEKSRFNKNYASRDDPSSSEPSFKLKINPQHQNHRNEEYKYVSSAKEHDELAYYKKREQELISDVNHLQINLKQYKELNDELNNKLKTSFNPREKRHSFQNFTGTPDKCKCDSNETYFMEKYHESEKTIKNLKHEMMSLKGEMELNTQTQDTKISINNSDDVVRELKTRNRELNRKLKNLNKEIEENMRHNYPGSSGNYRDLFEQECENSRSIKLEIEKLRRMNDSHNTCYTKLVEDLNVLKVKHMTSDNTISTMAAQLEREKRQIKQLKDKNEYLQRILRIHGYDHENQTIGHAQEYTTSKYQNYVTNSFQNPTGTGSRLYSAEYGDIRNLCSKEISKSKTLSTMSNFDTSNDNTQDNVKTSIKLFDNEIQANKVQGNMNTSKAPRFSSVSNNNGVYKVDSTLRKENFVNSDKESHDFPSDNKEYLLESHLHETQANPIKSSIDSKVSPITVGYFKNRLDEYGTTDSQFVNIFNDPQSTSKKELKNSQDSRIRSNSGNQLKLDGLDSETPHYFLSKDRMTKDHNRW